MTKVSLARGRPCNRGKSDTPITRSLRRLGEQGLVRQGMSLDDPGDLRYYAATPLGVRVALKTHELRPVSLVLSEMRRAGLSVA